jgi:hypothetical protein
MQLGAHAFVPIAAAEDDESVGMHLPDSPGQGQRSEVLGRARAEANEVIGAPVDGLEAAVYEARRSVPGAPDEFDVDVGKLPAAA